MDRFTARLMKPTCAGPRYSRAIAIILRNRRAAAGHSSLVTQRENTDTSDSTWSLTIFHFSASSPLMTGTVDKKPNGSPNACAVVVRANEARCLTWVSFGAGALCHMLLPLRCPRCHTRTTEGTALRVGGSRLDARLIGTLSWWN